MKYSLLFILSLSLNQLVFSQDDVKRLMYYGNLEFSGEQYEDAFGYFEDAVSYSPLNFKANYNLANTLYRLGDYPKAIESYEKIVNLGPTSFDKSKVYHNMGNAHMMSQNLDGAIEAYKNGLRLNPSDEETRYNLAYAINLKREQEKKEQESEQNNENSNGEGSDSENENDNENEENNSENEENESGDQEKDEEEQENDEQSEQNSEANKEENQEEKDDGGQQFSNKMSKEDIQRILDTYYKREKELQERLDKNKRVGYGSPKKKDW